MNIVTLDLDVRKKLEHALNAKIPGPDDEAFEGFSQSLRIAHPELHRELLQGIKVATKMPVETAMKRAAWRSGLRETVNRLFYQKRWPDDLVLDKKRVMFAGLGTLMLLLPVAFLLSGNLIGTRTEAVVPTPQPTEEAITESAQPSEQADVVSVRSSSRVASSSKSVEPQSVISTNDARTPIPPENLPQTQTTSSSSSSFTPFPTTTPPQPTPTQIPSSFANQSSEPALPTQLTVATSPSRPETLAVWQNEASARATSSDSLLGGPPSSLSSDSRGTQTPTVFARQAEQPLTPLVYANSNTTPEIALPISVTTSKQENSSSQQAEGASLTIYARKGSAEPSPSVSPIVFSQNQTGVVENISSSPVKYLHSKLAGWEPPGTSS